MKKRFVITGIKSDGNRHLSFDNNACNHFDTKEEAESWLNGAKENMPQNRIELLGKDVKIMQVACFESGEAQQAFYLPK